MTKINSIFKALSAVIDPKPELNYTTILDLLVAVVLSAQTTDKAVNAVTDKIWRHCRVPADYVSMGEERLSEMIRSIGMYRQKARHIVELNRIIMTKYDSNVPGDFDTLVSLPGVGVKTANVVLNVGFGQPRIAVDTHIFRVSNRLGIAVASTPEKVGEILMDITPKRYLKDAHHYLLLHGRYTCTARNPKCDACCVKRWCAAAQGGMG